MAPGWSFLALPLGVITAGLALSGILLRRRGRPWSAGALVLGVGTVVWGVIQLGASVPSEPGLTPTSRGSDPAESLVDGTRAEAMDAADPDDPDAMVVTYEIATDGLSVTHLSYVDLVDGVPTMVEALGVPPPFEHRIVVPGDSGLDLADLSVTGMGGATSRQTTCRITVDGRTVATSLADSSYGLVTCSVPPQPVD